MAPAVPCGAAGAGFTERRLSGSGLDDLPGDDDTHLVDAARTGDIGDGRLFVYDVVETVRIRTNERGEDTVRHAAAEGWGH